MNEERIATFAERIQEYMSLYDVKAVDLAKRFHVSRSTISQYVNGIVVPKRDRLVLIADALKIDPLWLMGYDVPIERQKLVTSDLTQTEQDIVKAYRSASPDTQIAVCAVLGVKKGTEPETEEHIG